MLTFVVTVAVAVVVTRPRSDVTTIRRLSSEHKPNKL